MRPTGKNKNGPRNQISHPDTPKVQSPKQPPNRTKPPTHPSPLFSDDAPNTTVDQTNLYQAMISSLVHVITKEQRKAGQRPRSARKPLRRPNPRSTKAAEIRPPGPLLLPQPVPSSPESEDEKSESSPPSNPSGMLEDATGSAPPGTPAAERPRRRADTSADTEAPRGPAAERPRHRASGADPEAPGSPASEGDRQADEDGDDSAAEPSRTPPPASTLTKPPRAETRSEYDSPKSSPETTIRNTKRVPQLMGNSIIRQNPTPPHSTHCRSLSKRNKEKTKLNQSSNRQSPSIHRRTYGG
ncbi:hypothetical protein JYU34_009069 [Plutella xylostella]|uniref:Uncharacterized protein n=1 Tax=Plutella xylostella TaxID=51655 RepID=A0ABQ7QMI2_PLUXY|nr:hypothetical protein JYU34_009069 [Plutella xylostella]